MSRQALHRAIALAQLRATSTDDGALAEVEAYLMRALDLVREERAGKDPLHVALARALRGTGAIGAFTTLDVRQVAPGVGGANLPVRKG